MSTRQHDVYNLRVVADAACDVTTKDCRLFVETRWSAWQLRQNFSRAGYTVADAKQLLDRDGKPTGTAWIDFKGACAARYAATILTLFCAAPLSGTPRVLGICDSGSEPTVVFFGQVPVAVESLVVADICHHHGPALNYVSIPARDYRPYRRGGFKLTFPNELLALRAVTALHKVLEGGQQRDGTPTLITATFSTESHRTLSDAAWCHVGRELGDAARHNVARRQTMAAPAKTSFAPLVHRGGGGGGPRT
jgi:hypothetical protein